MQSIRNSSYLADQESAFIKIYTNNGSDKRESLSGLIQNEKFKVKNYCNY